ncbi:MAG: hypothetical protein MJZ57_05040 [Bacteroidales bacterium]|nr:hypothetical protein [Bacteroidales bacterium]
MKKLFSILTVCGLLLGFAACDPTPEPGPGPDEPVIPTDSTDVPVVQNPFENFIGEYNLHIDVEGYYVNDDPADSQSEEFNGTLSITLPEGIDNPEFVNVLGVFNFGNGEQREVYNTTGSLDANGNLVLESSTFMAAVPITISYETISQNQPLTWYSTMACEISGYDVRYELFNKATKIR